MRFLKKNKKGFTLVELIIVIAIIAILAVTLIPMGMNYIENARRTAAQTTINTINTSYTSFVITAGTAVELADIKSNVQGLTDAVALGSEVTGANGNNYIFVDVDDLNTYKIRCYYSASKYIEFDSVSGSQTDSDA